MRMKHVDNIPCNDHMADILDTVSDAFLTSDRESLVTYVNKEMGKLLNRNTGDLIGVHLADLIPESTGWMFRLHFENAMIHGKAGTFEGFRFANRTFEVFFYPTRDSVTISLRDITTRRQVDELSKLALFMLDRINEKVFLVRSDGRLFHVNEETCRTLGYSHKELIHMKIFDVDPTFKLKDWNDRFSNIKKMGNIAFESMLKPKSGGLIPVEVHANYILLYGVEYYCVAARDITERKKAEEELRHAHSDLEKKVEERTKELFHEKMEAELYLDLMGHDISNMHHIALGQLELAHEIMAEKGHLEGDEKELIDTPLRILERSARLIDNVRKIQQLRRSELKEETIYLNDMLSGIVKEYGPIAPDSPIKFAGNGRSCVVADKLLHDVFSNLVDNAIKHSNEKCVDIRIKLRTTSVNGKKYHKVSIEDDGPGIPDDMKEKIFNRLQHGQAKARGLGLGLYLVKSLVDSYHGRVWVEDRVKGDHGKGAKFVVILPAAEDPYDC